MCWNGPPSPPCAAVRGVGDCEADINWQQRTIMMAKIRGLVSKNKKRFKQDGFDLDLSYIKDNIIAMGFPAAKLESVYRNHIDDVARCETERTYDEGKFSNRVVSYPFDDHNPPDLTIIQPFCEDVDRWLTANEKNVAVVHCKAGKGRTGVMICCYLLHTAEFKTPEEALHYYGQQRTRDTNGVTVPSQRRYVHYYHQLLMQRNMRIETVSMLLRYFEFEGVPSFDIAGGSSPYFVVYSGKKRVYKSAVFDIKRGTRCFRMNIPTSDRIVVFGDVKVVFYHKPRRLAKKQKMFQFYFNTYFVKPVTKMERTNSPFSQHHSDPTPSISSRYSTTRNCFSKDDSYLPSKESDTRQVKTDICCSKLSPSFPFFKNSPFPQRTPHSGQPLNLSVDSNGQEHLATQMSTDRRHSREEAQFVECGNTLDSPTGFSDWQSVITHELVLTKAELDRAVKDRHCRHFPDDFKIRMVLHSINENEPIPLESDQRELIVIPPVRGSLLPLKLNLEANGKVISNEEPTGKRLDSGICMTESSGLHCRQDGFKMVQEEPNPSCVSDDLPSTGAASSVASSSDASDSNSAWDCTTGCACRNSPPNEIGRMRFTATAACQTTIHCCKGCRSLNNSCLSAPDQSVRHGSGQCRRKSKPKLSGSRSAEPLGSEHGPYPKVDGALDNSVAVPSYHIVKPGNLTATCESTYICADHYNNVARGDLEGFGAVSMSRTVKDRRGTFPR